MTNNISYEWCAEFVDEYDDIQETDSSTNKADIWPPKFEVENCKARLSCARILGDDVNGIQERGYAYAGDETFSTGQKVPPQIKKQLQAAKKIKESI
ncbi:hypothetical protein GCM10007891_24720 [Methylophaga thalassica]|uniref:Uncharacterized protein n=1 Tax=Methylophaga thalassica TaxID=40223 RepID=A0ABQ5TX63_9GAMM|nr:hypothetical protein [Methylophaga thalassica]GLQ00619.1 hypothetical protein GCM10007891_24720 [Methylophaga thalassica]